MNVEETCRDILEKMEPTIEMEECEACGESYVGGSELSGRMSYLEYDEEQRKMVYKHVNLCPTCVTKLVSVNYDYSEEK